MWLFNGGRKEWVIQVTIRMRQGKMPTTIGGASARIIDSPPLPTEAANISRCGYPYPSTASARFHAIPPSSPNALSTSPISKFIITRLSHGGFLPRMTPPPSSTRTAREHARESRTSVRSEGVGIREEMDTPRVGVYEMCWSWIYNTLRTSEVAIRRRLKE